MYIVLIFQSVLHWFSLQTLHGEAILPGGETGLGREVCDTNVFAHSELKKKHVSVVFFSTQSVSLQCPYVRFAICSPDAVVSIIR